MIRMTMRKKIVIFFICLVTIPIVIIYFVASSFFIKSTQEDLKNIYSANIQEVGKNVDVFFSDAMDLTIYPLMEQNLKTFLTTASDHPDYKRIKKNASDILLSMPYGFSSGIHSITLLTLENDSISIGNNSKLSPADISKSKELNASPYWDYAQGAKQNGYLYLTRLLKNPSDISQHIGYIKLSISCSKISSSIEANQKDNQTSYFLVAPDDHYIIESDNRQYLDNQNSILTHQELMDLAMSSDNSTIVEKQIVSAYPVKNTSLIIFSITEPDVLSLVTRTFSLNLGGLAILVFAFSLILSIGFSKIITKPLDRLGQHMTSISNEDFSVRFHIKGSDEISMLAAHFNQMAEKLDFLYHQVYMGELKLKQSQLDMLQTQINPHFLYNTLDTIYWMSRMGDTKLVSSMVSNVSRMMRLTLSPKTNDKILLSQELEHLSCYIEIQKIRYGEKVSFHLSCEEEIKKDYVLCFLLQPLVENALVHGLKDCLDGIVRISIYSDDHTIVYEVANNGDLVDVEGVEAILLSDNKDLKGFAIRNINERIHLKYGNGYQLSCHIQNGFSVFTIVQPKKGTEHD